jgi:hypothetical protein
VVVVYKVDPTTRRIVRIDDGGFATPGGNYGFTFYRHSDGRLFAYTGPESTTILRQYEVVDVGGGRVSGVQTAWSFERSQMEGMVGDDETGYLYVGEEAAGLWKINAMDASDATLIAAVGDASGIQADVEGVTIYRAAGGAGYVIASSQGSDAFIVFDREAPNAPIGEFQLTGVGSTDGIDVLNLALGPFTEGIFAAHNGAACCPVQAASWGDIARSLGLSIDTSGDVRAGTCTALGTEEPTTADGGVSAGGGFGGAAASGGAAAASGVSPDGGADPSSSDGGGGSGDDSGCGCYLGRRGGSGAGPVLALGLIVLLARPLSGRRRRSRQNHPADGCSGRRAS